MTQSERLDFLIKYLISEMNEPKSFHIPAEENARKHTGERFDTRPIIMPGILLHRLQERFAHRVHENTPIL